MLLLLLPIVMVNQTAKVNVKIDCMRLNFTDIVGFIQNIYENPVSFRLVDIRVEQTARTRG